MKERLVTLGCALAALALFYGIFMPTPRFDAPTESPPTSAEATRNGYLGAWRWLEAESIRTESLRDRYPRLVDERSGRAATGNLLITTLPHRYGVRRHEIDDLQTWIAAGNTLLVLAAFADTPDWTMRHANDDLFGQVAAISGVRFVAAPRERNESFTDAFKRLTEAQRHRIVPNRAHPLFDGVREVIAESEFPADEWRAIAPRGDFMLSLAHDADTHRDAFWIRRYGAGQIMISAFGSIFANEQLSHRDNARLLGNIVAQSLGDDGTVIFDDQHQGLSSLYDARAFFADSRLHVTIALLLFLWLVWVLGSVPLRLDTSVQAAPNEAAFIEATGGFFARVLRPAQAGARLLDLFLDDVRRRLRVSGDRDCAWKRLERDATLRTDLEALRAYDARLRANRRVDLVALQNLLRRIEARL
jgi:hypothetical protein